MTDVYQAPQSDLTLNPIQSYAVRPLCVVVIAALFFIFAIYDLFDVINSEFITTTKKVDAEGNVVHRGFQANLGWLASYAVGAGLMRGGRFARGVACFFGVLALIIPGAVFIYFLYFSEAKHYFNKKHCSNCGETKYANIHFPFKGIRCRQCGTEIELRKA